MSEKQYTYNVSATEVIKPEDNSIYGKCNTEHLFMQVQATKADLAVQEAMTFWVLASKGCLVEVMAFRVLKDEPEGTKPDSFRAKNGEGILVGYVKGTVDGEEDGAVVYGVTLEQLEYQAASEAQQSGFENVTLEILEGAVKLDVDNYF